VAKVLSTARAPLEGIRKLLGLGAEAPIPPCSIRMGTTVATNALLERRGEPSLLVITRGFRDLLEIGTQARPKLFDLEIRKPPPLYAEVIEVDARCSANGEVLTRPDWTQVRKDLEFARSRGFSSLAVVVLNSYANGELEVELGRLAREVGFPHVVLSHEAAPEMGLLARGDTALLDAYLTPLVARYARSLIDELPGSRLELMQSSGGLCAASRLRGQHAILSGPAGGFVAAAEIARRAAVSQAIFFDMGGTSTDVSRFSGEFDRSYETEIAGVRVRAPMMNIHTVAAGGGSICRTDGYRLSVGPDSAGADPGPLCYGNPRAVELTLTDVNVLLGRLPSERFPFELETARAAQKLLEIQRQLAERGTYKTTVELCQGFLEIANANMAEAIRQVSIARGYDVREHTLIVFGGAGGQHAGALAKKLGIRRVLVHPLAGVLSAYGMGLAARSSSKERDLGRDALTPVSLVHAVGVARELETLARAELAAENGAGELRIINRVDLRYAGTDSPLTLELASLAELEIRFAQAHARAYGFSRSDVAIELVAVRVEALWERDLPAFRPPRAGKNAGSGSAEVGSPNSDGAKSLRHVEVWFGSAPERTPVFARETLLAGQSVPGPALILEDTSTLVLEPGSQAFVEADGTLRIEVESLAANAEAEERTRASSRELDAEPADPILLEVMSHAFMSIAEQMGHLLRRTAVSTNIRERLDFSCAVFDRDAGLVANAPHIPVHLGAMSESVRAVIAAHPDAEDGDAFLTNDPTAGGSHLPDITVVSPIFVGGKLEFFCANRGHHADVGGTTPGSMPADSTRLEEEGVIFRALRAVHRGVFERDAVLRALRAGPFPARHPSQNLADLEAQLAANRLGTEQLLALTRDHGVDRVRHYMRHVQDYGAARVLREIARLEPGSRHFTDQLDNGAVITVALTLGPDTLTLDFTGTSPEHAGNLNAPRAVTVAAVMYFLRSLANDSMPLNSGCLRPVTLILPHPSLLSPGPTRAVAGGNVETSQRLVDVLLGAAGVAAASQGTMNNLTLGNERFAYYETIGGGAGAGPGFRGASAVHTHMTNTRITDPEVLEARYPLRLVEFSIRRGSGGHGEFPGGDGICRELEALEPMRISLLSNRRTLAPFGLAGGAAGQPGRNLVNGKQMPSSFSIELEPGARIRVETPGGGGYGPPGIPS
jgi:5-oxoprolinase (ATP-hydrolysing)